jgi:hypothetical protein
MKSFLLQFSISVCLLMFTVLATNAQDTTWVQTFTWEEQNDPETAYDSPGRRWFNLPEDDGTTYQKILMYYNLKCFEQGTAGNLGFACGEWDYLTYTYLYDHTGMLDSNEVMHPFYLANNQDFDTANVAMEGYNHTQDYPLFQTLLLNTISEDAYALDYGEEDISLPLGSESGKRRTQFIISAQELIDLGMVAGDIEALRLSVSAVDSSPEWLQIGHKLTTSEEVSGFENDLTPAFAWNPSITDPGTYMFMLSEPIAWDGTSNVLLEITYQNTSGNPGTMTEGGTGGFNTTISTDLDDGYIRFNWWDEVKVPAEALASINDVVSISFWLRGDEDLQPENSTIFEGVNADNARVLNSHLPWSNANVYWDAGQDGGYDRINKLALESEFEGDWTHWAFTKNTNTGEMKIYVNGILWHSGEDKDNPMDGIVKFSIGAATGWSNYYDGDMDEFRLWNAELDEATISEWMYRDLDDSHPNYDELKVYYKFNGDNGEPILDMSPNGFDGVPHGSPNLLKFNSHELFRNGVISGDRPDITLLQGEYEADMATSVQTVEYPEPPIVVSEWVVDGNYVEVVDLQYYWPEGYAYSFDVDGEVVDSLWNGADTEIINSDLMYFQPPYEVVDRYELGRYITPYGINLTLDDDGWTWIYDVTDFEPLLHDSVDISAGNWQELLDMKFAFIEGTPPREVKRIERIWNGNWGLADWEESIEDKTLEFEPEDIMAKVATTATGHGFGQGANCAEFCPNTHSLAVNGNSEFSFEIIQECADNPLYPQGGTWIYDRAGWCPGMEGRIEEFDVSQWIEDGAITLDYDIEEDPYGNYVFESYMFTYGPYNLVNDVEISKIISPSVFKLNSRVNPMCNKPQVEIRNNGSATLESCVFTFGVEGMDMQTYNWTGSLAPMEKAVVDLQYNSSEMWVGDDEELLTFLITVDQPNGVADEQTSNNSSSSPFYRPPTYSYDDLDEDRLILWFVSNNANWESSYSLYNIYGDEVFARDDFNTAATTYRDTIQLGQGCYMFHLKDSGDDGLSFFANNDGSGSMRFKKVQSGILKHFEDDFGKEIKHYFYWDTNTPSGIEPINEDFSARIFPNPTTGNISLKLKGFDSDVSLSIYDLEGRLVHSEQYNHRGEGHVKNIDFNGFSDGVYFLRATDGQHSVNEKVILQR